MSISKNHIIPVAFFVVLSLSLPAFADNGFSETACYEADEQVLRTIVTSENIKAIVLLDGFGERVTGFASPFFSVGEFYRKGLLSLVDNPQHLTPDSHAFSETTGVALKTDLLSSSLPSIAFSPLPDYCSCFFFNEYGDRISGIDFLVPFTEALSIELLYQYAVKPVPPPDEQWYQDDRSFQGTSLHNASLSVKSTIDLFSMALCGGCSFSEMNFPGYFVLFRALLDAPDFNCTFSACYRSRFYFSPRSVNSSECVSIGACVEFTPDAGVHIKGHGDFKRMQSGPVNESGIIDSFEAGADFQLSLGVTRRCRVWLETSGVFSGRVEAFAVEYDYSMDARIKMRLVSNHEMFFSYRCQNDDGEDDHTVSAQYGFSVENFSCSGRLTHSFPDSQQEARLLMVFSTGALRFRLEAKVNLTALQPDTAAPFSLKLGAAYSP